MRVIEIFEKTVSVAIFPFCSQIVLPKNMNGKTTTITEMEYHG